MDWLEKNRPHAFQNRQKEKLKLSIQTTLSAQANKKHPKIWRYKIDGSKDPGYIWLLSSTPAESEGVPLESTHSGLTKDTLGENRNDVSKEISSSPALSKEHSVPLQDISASSLVKPLRQGSQGVAAADPEHEYQASASRSSSLPGCRGQEKQATRMNRAEASYKPQPSRTDPSIGPAAQHQPQRPSNIMNLKSGDSVLSSNVETFRTAAADDSASPPSQAIPEETNPAHDRTRQGLADHNIDSETNQDLYFGRLVMQIHRLRQQRTVVEQGIKFKRASLQEVDALEREVNDLQKQAEELEQQALQTRGQADATLKKLESARINGAELAAANRHLEKLDKGICESKEKLGID